MKKILRETLIGAILGDAHIGKTGLNKAFISFEQSSKKAEYLNSLHELIKKEGWRSPSFNGRYCKILFKTRFKI